MNNTITPDFIFETSWEVCNKIGGIYTVMSTKLAVLQKNMGDNVVYIGPDFDNGTDNPDFKQDDDIFKEWKESALNLEIPMRIGRWNIAGAPKTILVDFEVLYARKNEILTKLWENYGVDSLLGSDIYISSVLFGYAVGKVIDSFVDFYNLQNQNVIAHFHEWMSGAGVLYLKNNSPYIGTVFTTHATSLGRSLCSNSQQLYNYLDSQPEFPEQKAKELNISSQHSLEKVIAHNANCFTTVSKLTARECAVLLQKEPDCITLNGYEALTKKEMTEKKAKARAVLSKVAEGLVGGTENNPLFVVTSGRYEFRNKGIDLLINALTLLRTKETSRDIITFILIPGEHRGINKELKENIEHGNIILSNKQTTHTLSDPLHDTILNALAYHNIKNAEEDNVKVILAPIYLNGNDGIFNLSYYDLLPGFDLSIFPSYYEPWGYTPQESVGAGVPTITTTLAGFGLWAQKEMTYNTTEKAVNVITRTENNFAEASSNLAQTIQKFLTLSSGSYEEILKGTLELAKKFSWKNFYSQYEDGYSIALEKVSENQKQIDNTQLKINKSIQTMQMNWKKLLVQSDLPEPLKKLEEISMNLWWAWHDEAQELFRIIDEEVWFESEKNPVLLLRRINRKRLMTLAEDKAYLRKLEHVYDDFKTYMSEKPAEKEQHIAYFSMEYGLTNILKIYSGGLGILAGDYLKEASDSNIPMVAVGFMYKHGYFKQQLSSEGAQIAIYDTQVFSELPIKLLKGENNEPITLSLQFPGRKVYFRVWQVQVGRVDLYLLDTTTTENSEEDRLITHALYGGNWENRIKQEIILGMGGVKALKHLNLNCNICHLNEGHAAFANLERLINYVDSELSFDEALEIVRASSLFTTHTPVPAGHDAFTEDFIRNYLYDVPGKLNLSWEDFLGLGRFNPHNHSEKFSMSVFAAKTSQETNGVSRLHGEVSRKMFNDLWPGYGYNELALGHVTNGVHYTTWAAPEWKELHKKYLNKTYIKDLSNKKLWNDIYHVPDSEIWTVRTTLRKKLIDYIRNRMVENWVRRNEDPQVLVDIRKNISEDVLTIGFARRFATYKRAHLLFSDLDRLAKLLNNPERPVQILFAGKAHPADQAGQDSMKRIIEISRLPEFAGKILFMENYNINLAKYLIRGVDVWLNTPTRPLEASGTSGQKAAMNGVLNFSVLDGWWVEGYKNNAGWSLPEERTYDNQGMQDKLDAASIYYKLEKEIIPMFYDRDEQQIPRQWIQYIKNNFAEITPEFTTKRMIDDYNDKFYRKLHQRTNVLRENEYAPAKQIVKWKNNINSHWGKIEVVKIDFPNTLLNPYVAGEKFEGMLVLDLKELKDEELTVEMVFTRNNNQSKMEIIDVKALELDKKEGSLVYYKTSFKINSPGLYDYGIRISPKNEALPHKQDFVCLSWV